MTTAFWCILAAALLPYLFTAIAKATGKRFDNRDPRSWQAKLTGLPARANEELRFVREAMAPGPGLPVKALAYCFCGM